MDSEPNDIIAIYRQRWEIELLFKQIKQNFPLNTSMEKVLMPLKFKFGLP